MSLIIFQIFIEHENQLFLFEKQDKFFLLNFNKGGNR